MYMSIPSETFFPKPTAVRFFPAEHPRQFILPKDAHLDRSQDLLQLVYQGNKYTLGVSPKGVIVGFIGKLEKYKAAAICLIQLTPLSVKLYDREFDAPDDIHAEYEKARKAHEAAKQVNQPPASVASSGEPPSANDGAIQSESQGPIKCYS